MRSRIKTIDDDVTNNVHRTTFDELKHLKMLRNLGEIEARLDQHLQTRRM